MKKRLACFLSVLIGIAIPLACHADPLPDTTVDGLHWRFEQLHDTGHDDDYEVAARRGEQVLIWDNGKNRQAYAEAVFLLVSAPTIRCSRWCSAYCNGRAGNSQRQ